MEKQSRRYVATGLRAEIMAQGLRQDWIADQVGISPSLLNQIVQGRRTAGGDVAERVALLLRRPFFVLFDLRESSRMQPSNSKTGQVSA